MFSSNSNHITYMSHSGFQAFLPYILAYVCVYIYIYIYTYIHTHTRASQKVMFFFFSKEIITNQHRNKYHTSKWSWFSMNHIPTSQHSHHFSMPRKTILTVLSGWFLAKEKQTLRHTLRPWQGSKQESDKRDLICKLIMSSFCMTMLDHTQASGHGR